MPDVSAMIAQQLSAVGPQKQATVVDTSTQKKALLGSPEMDRAYVAAAARNSNPSLVPGAEPTPTTLDFTRSLITQSLGDSMFYGDRKAIRSEEEFYRDSAISIGSGFVNSIAGIGALGLGVLNPNLGVEATKGIEKLNTFVQDKQSAGLNARRRAYGVVSELDKAENRQQFVEDQADDGVFVASLKRIGRDILDSGQNALEDGMVAQDGVATGVGSLLAAGPLGKVAKAAGVSQAASVPVAIGAMEGGSAYQAAVQEALSQGADNGKANAAGLIAAAIQAPAAAATGTLVSKFEGAPLTVSSARSAAGNIIRETLEEGLQSGSGQLAENIAVRAKVNPDQELSDGLGEQIALGALYGSGTAGVVQAPGAAVQAPIAAVQAAVKPILNRADRFLKGQEAKAAQRATQAQETAFNEAVAVQQDLQDIVQAKGGEQAPQMAEYLTRLFDKARFDPAESQGEAPVIQEAVQGSTDRFTALRQVADKILDPNTSDEDRTTAGAYLLKQTDQYKGLLIGDLVDAIQRIDEKDPEQKKSLKKLEEFQDVILTLTQHPAIGAALIRAREAANSPKIQAQFSDKALSTPEGVQLAQRSAEAVISLASVEPEKADEKTLEVIRSHAVAGRLNLTPEQRGILETASALVRATREMQEQKKALGLTLPDRVTQEVQSRDEADSSDLVKKSAVEHAKGVLSALRSGDRDQARARLTDFMLFSQHMQNKVDAFNRNYASRRPDVKTSFQALSPNEGRPWYEAPGVFLNPKAESSVKLAQQTALDARAVASLANGVAEAFPDLGVQGVSPVALGIDPELNRPAQDIVKEHQKPRNTSSEQEVNTVERQVSPQDAVVEETPATTQDRPSETVAATEVDKDQQPLPFEKPVEPLKEVEQPTLPLEAGRPYEKMSAEDIDEMVVQDMPALYDPEKAYSEEEVIKHVAERVSAKDLVSGGSFFSAIIDHKGRLWTLKNLAGGYPSHLDFVLDLRAGTHNKLAGLDYIRLTGFKNQIAADVIGGKGFPPNNKQLETLQAIKAQAARAGVQYVTTDYMEAWEGSSQQGSTAEAVSESPPPEPFADLLGSRDGQNWFKKAFRFPTEARTRLIGLGDQVVSTIAKALSSQTTFEDLLGSKASHKLTSDLVRAYKAYLAEAPKLEAALDGRLKAFLSENYVTSKKGVAELARQGIENPTFLDLLQGRNPLGREISPATMTRGKTLNLVQDVDGQLSYEPELLQQAVLAAMQWLLTSESRPSRTLDEQDVADILGVAPTEVPEGAEEFFNDGLSITEAKQSLADTITRFWGVDANRDAPLGYTKGIPEAMAAELLLALQDVGLVEIFDAEFGQGEDTRTFKRVGLSQTKDTVAAVGAMKAYPSAIEQLALINPEETRFIGAPPKSVPEFQMRNRLVRNTDQQKAALKAEQETPHFINTQMVSFYEALGEDLVVALFGGGELDEKKLNKNHLLSLKGKNASIRGAYRALTGLLDELRNKASVAGVDPSDMPIHYAYNVSRVGRMHMLGLHNPQSSKLMREAVLPTRVTVDLTRPENYAKFALAIGQAWGEKVHKQPRGTTQNAVAILARGAFAGALSALDAHLSGQGSPDQLVADLKAAFGDKLSPAAVHAAMELARFNRASDSEKKAFTTDLYVEADGVTDGPVNALVHISTGAFTSKWVQLVAKGGLFLGQAGMTVNEFVGQGGESARDLYQATTDAFQTKIGRFRKELSSDVNVFGLADHLYELMDALLGSDVSFDGENLVVQRGIAKNPLTVTIYGSGAAGIADKVTGALVSALYENLSEQLQQRSNGNPRLEELIAVLTNNIVFRKEGALTHAEVSLKTAQPENNSLQGYTLTPDQVKNLKQNVLHLFVAPLRDAIEETIEDTKAGRDALKESIQVQSIFLEHQFKKLVNEALEALPENERTGFLSQAQMDQIYDKLKAMSPLVETGTMSFFVGGTEKSDVETSVFAKSLDDQLSTPAYVYGPTDAGVAGIPYLVIGPGDGQMMQNLATMAGAPKGTLKVFDGVHIKLDTLDEDSVKVNQAVYEAWGQNPLAAVNTSFEAFLETVSFKDMSAEQVAALGRALGAKKGETLTPKQIEADVREIGRNLKRLSEQAEARHRALSKVQMSVDHMASAEAPYQAAGESLEGLTHVEIAERLNQLAREELLALRAEKAKDPATEEAKIDPTVTPASGLLKLVRAMKIPAEQKNLLIEVARSLAKTGWQVVQDDVVVRDRHGNLIKGQTHLSNQTIYLHTQETETLLHELLHASTTQKILDHYQGKTSPDVAEAIGQLETLMGQWMALEEDLSGLSPEQRRAYKDALRVVKIELNRSDRITQENRAAALDEFLAWNLSNQDLIKIAQKTKVENPLARVVKRVLIALKNLIWGRKMSPMVRSDMYSALRFNASVLINATPTLQSRALKTVRQQSTAYGTNTRLEDLKHKLALKIHNYLNELPVVDQTKAEQDLLRLRLAVTEGFRRNGFAMTPQEEHVFSALVGVFATQAKLDPAALARVQELYTHVNKVLTVEDLMVDPNSQNQADRYAAQLKHSALKGIDYRTGRSIVETDVAGRSSLMPAFLALATVNDEFRQVLSKIELPKAERKANDSLDNMLTNAGNTALDEMSRLLSGEGRGRKNVQEAIDALTNVLAEDQTRDENVISQLASPVTRAINGLNDKVVDLAQKTSKTLIERATELQDQTDNKATKAVLEIGKGIASVANEDEARLLAEGWISTANRLKIFRPAHEFLNDLIGRTESNAPVYDLIKKVRSVVQQMRQQFREHLPGLIAQRFSRELTSEEWTHLFKGMAKTDLAVLRQNYTLDQMLELLKDQGRLASEIRRLEDLVQGEAGRDTWQLMKPKAEQLAHFMTTGEPGDHLLRNAEAVANLFGVSGARAYTPSRTLLGRVDQLVSLYALDGLEAPVRASLASLAQDEAEGMSFTLSYLVGQRTAEQSKLTTDKARLNHYKGYVPSEPAAGAQLIVAKDIEEPRLRTLGYKRIGDYQGSSAEFGAEARGYYFAPLASRALFNQGIMQNVRHTASGVDPVTGHTHDGLLIAGQITNPRTVQRIKNRRAGATPEPLMPIFDATGEVIAYERSVDPNQEVLLHRDTHLARMIGVWRGRQAEESKAAEYNQLLIEALHDIWQRDKVAGREAEFVNLMDDDYLKTDPVVADAVKLFTPEAWDYVKATFGGEGFMVRRDMLNDAIGYRSASVGDVWTGKTRLPPQAADVAKRLAIGVFGLDAYKYLVTAEKLTQNLVSEARQMIVVKSVIVPVSNFIANIYQLSSRGVALSRIVRDMPKKLAETNAYVQRRTRQIELEAELRAAVGNVVSERRIKAELQSIDDANRRMSIWPLVDAGEFSSISEAGSLEKEETTLFEGKLSQYIEQKVNKLPPGLRTLGRYGLITQDTALFQGMRRAMEYGDFLAKAIRYDHLTQEKKLTPKDALASVTEEFVNYDRLSGRFRQGLENLGLLWFWNFKVRIAKIAVATIRENPVHALLTSLVPTPEFVGSIGTPLSDNLFTMSVDGNLEWSTGPGMGLRAYEMNPWLNLFR